ncbi:serine/threonine protein kinase [Nostoc sp. CENA67]|uniref:Serine/threonine protein kinase n=1 Tax=Amazonocrinis nigriterrae CENA67 TaxID=2794033 RepID=A0A8J7HP76_9NOST|nr:serine/threonine-protein kinase [Amazonocrinis nigriterrae]MBH8563092.1 serine/threonine protein kinase [Amazonocrinis nigriterrae CENA67]
MSYCLNPSCDQPLNSDGVEFCQSCGIKLIPLLRNRYRIIQPLGGGGFGRTFLAEDEDKLKEYCVVKQLVPQVTGTSALHKATELFREEARRLQQLGEHPQIPTLYAYFREENYLYLVQQLIKGKTLRQELKEQGMFSEDQIWEILSELLPVLKFIHEHQVVHRDLKPENIICRSSQDIDSRNSSTQQANLVLIDFGVAKQLTETSMEHTGTSIGSYGYASMEQMKHGFAYPASDLFSLGATCFYLLTGIPPYHLYMEEGYNWVTHWQEYLPSPISANLQHVLDKLLQKDMNYRYQSADEVLQDVPLQPKQAVVTQGMAVTPLPSRISLKSSVSPKTVIQPQILLPKKILLAGAGAIVLLLGTAGYLLYRQNLPLTGHLSEVNAIAFSPVVGKSASFEAIFASGSDDKTVKLWNLSQRREIRTFEGHSDWVYAVAISPDGLTIVSGSKDKTIKVWNLNTGQEIRTLRGHKSYVNSVAISPDGQTVVSGGYDKIIKVWNLNTGEEIRTLTGHSGEVLSVAISPDNQTIISGSTDDTIKIWNLSTGKEIRTLSNHSSDVNALAISPNGHLLVSASDDKTIKLWNLKTGKQIRTLTGHTADVNAIAFSPNGENVASGSDDKTVKVWNLSTGLAIHTFDKHTAEVFAVAYSPDGKTLVSGSKDNTIRIWHL